MTNIDMSDEEFEILLSVVRPEPMVKEEPRLEELLKNINFSNLCRHLILYYDGEKRCRYFDYVKKVFGLKLFFKIQQKVLKNLKFFQFTAPNNHQPILS